MLIDVDINEIEQAISTLNRLKEIAAKNEEKWQPKGGKFFINAHGVVGPTSTVSASATHFGTRFETEGSAKKAAKAYRKFHRLYKLAEELNEGWEPDWDDDLQPKFLIAERRGKYICNQLDILEFPHCVYFKDAETAQKAIKILEQEVD
jgi:hypothetical protein